MGFEIRKVGKWWRNQEDEAHKDIIFLLVILIRHVFLKLESEDQMSMDIFLWLSGNYCKRSLYVSSRNAR